MTKVLHVEDDHALSELVQMSFQAFGFHGETLVASTVKQANEILADTSKYPGIDLIVSDMYLPDGLGLDIVRRVRSDPARARVPILILSGSTDQALVDRAYALGANSYIAKNGNGAREIPEVMRTLYHHWLRDALLPRTPTRSRVQEVVAKGIVLRRRVGELFARFSRAFDGDLTQSSFWMSLALRQGNLANLLTFLEQQLGDRDLRAISLDRHVGYQRHQEELLDQIERALDETPERTFEIARDGVIDLMTEFDPEDFVEVTKHLFPVENAAVLALRQLLTREFEQVVAWVETYGDAVDERRLDKLRAITAHLHELLDEDPLVHPVTT